MWEAGLRLAAAARWTGNSRVGRAMCRRFPCPAPKPGAAWEICVQGRSNPAARGSQLPRSRDGIRFLSAVTKLEGSVESVDHVANLSRLQEEGQLNEALHALDTIGELGVDIPASLLTKLAEECFKRKSLAHGRLLESTVTARGLELESYAWNTLIRLYASLGSLDDAVRAFRKISQPDEYSWYGIITAHANLEQGEQGVELYKEMKRSGVRPSSHVYVAVLKACASTTALDVGREVHGDVSESGLESHEIVVNALMNMYAKCGSMAEAHKLFDGLSRRDVVSWTVMITGYTELRLYKEALDLFKEMQRQGVAPNKITYLSILRSCANTGSLAEGKQIHQQIIDSGLGTDTAIGNSLISMYSKCGTLTDARDVFDELDRKSIVSWNAMIGGYAQQGESQEALRLFQELQEQGMEPNAVTFLSTLRACNTPRFLEQGKEIHAQIISSRVDLDSAISTALVAMYAKCGGLDEARESFDLLTNKDVVSWTAMIGGYAQHGQGDKALELFKEMQEKGVELNQITYVNALKACSSIGALDEGRQIHRQVTENGHDLDVEVGSTLIDMYAKCGSLEEANNVFEQMPEKNAVSWNAIIAGYAQHGRKQEALEFFQRMLQQGIKPTEVTFLSILKATGGGLDQGKEIHAQVAESGFELDVTVANTLMDMYAKCGSLDEARKIFEKLPDKNTVSWNALVRGYVQQELYKEAIDVWTEMQEENLNMADKVTYLTIIKACTVIAAVSQGMLAHSLLKKSGIEIDEVLGSALVNMYAECGRMDVALRVFNGLPTRDVVTWTAFIGGHARHGSGEDALRLLKEMQEAGVKPDHVTFLCVLNACSHAGLLPEGWELFDSMSKEYGVEPTSAHYGCMVGLFSRAGYLDVATDFIDHLVPNPDVNVWMALLGACRTYFEVELGKHAFERIMELDPTNSAAYVIMSSLYGLAEKQEEEAEIRRKMKAAGLKKTPGRTWIEVDYRVYSFLVEDQDHPNRHDVYSQLWRLTKAVKDLEAPKRRVGFKVH